MTQILISFHRIRTSMPNAMNGPNSNAWCRVKQNNQSITCKWTEESTHDIQIQNICSWYTNGRENWNKYQCMQYQGRFKVIVGPRHSHIRRPSCILCIKAKHFHIISWRHVYHRMFMIPVLRSFVLRNGNLFNFMWILTALKNLY